MKPEATVRVSKKSDVAILSCLATGNPAPILVWAKNGREFFYPGSQDADRIFIEVRLSQPTPQRADKCQQYSS